MVHTAGAMFGAMAILLAGCTASTDLDALAPAHIMLDDLQNCDLSWDDGAKAPCTTNVPVLETVDGRPGAPWICLRSYGFNDAQIFLYWHPLDLYAVAAGLDGKSGAPVGTFGGSGDVKAVWFPTAGRTSHAVLPSGDLLATPFVVSHASMDSDDPRLQGSLRVDVVARSGEHAPILHVGTDPQYHFSPLGRGYVGHVGFTFFGSLGIDTLLFAGVDFDADVKIERSGDFWIGALSAGRCTL